MNALCIEDWTELEAEDEASVVVAALPSDWHDAADCLQPGPADSR